MLITISSHAQNIEAINKCTVDKELNLVYLNGVNNFIEPHVNKSVRHIGELLNRKQGLANLKVDDLCVSYSYNQSRYLEDAVETIALKVKEAMEAKGEVFSWIDVATFFFSNPAYIATLRRIGYTPAQITTLMATTYESYRVTEQLYEDLDSTSSDVELFLSKNPTLLVSHSEGNLFANEIYKKLKSKNNPELTKRLETKFANLQVASAANRLDAEISDHYTVVQDNIISRLLDSIPNITILPTNVNLNSSLPTLLLNDPTIHGFVETYTNSELIGIIDGNKTDTMENIFYEKLNTLAEKVLDSTDSFQVVKTNNIRIHYFQVPYSQSWITFVNEATGEQKKPDWSLVDEVKISVYPRGIKRGKILPDGSVSIFDETVLVEEYSAKNLGLDENNIYKFDITKLNVSFSDTDLLIEDNSYKEAIPSGGTRYREYTEKIELDQLTSHMSEFTAFENTYSETTQFIGLYYTPVRTVIPTSVANFKFSFKMKNGKILENNIIAKEYRDGVVSGGTVQVRMDPNIKRYETTCMDSEGLNLANSSINYFYEGASINCFNIALHGGGYSTTFHNLKAGKHLICQRERYVNAEDKFYILDNSSSGAICTE